MNTSDVLDRIDSVLKDAPKLRNDFHTVCNYLHDIEYENKELRKKIRKAKKSVETLREFL